MLRRAVITTLPMLLLVHSGCGDGEGPQRPVPDREDGVPIVWIDPAPGESIVADTIRIELAIRGTGIGVVAVMADDSLLASLSSPPWRVRWLPRGGARSLLLGAAVGNATRAERTIRWSPDGPPWIEITGIPAAGGLEHGAGDSLRANASDPEDGDLDGEAIVWTSDVQGILGFGRRIPSEALIRGPHAIRARASDRWGRSAKAERAVEVFDPPDPTVPEGAIEAIRIAMLTADSSAYGSLIDAAFRFLLCPAERREDPSLPVGWGFNEEQTFAGRLGKLTRAAWTVSSLQRQQVDGEDWAKCEMTTLTIHYGETEDGPLRVFGGRGRIYLRRAPGQVTWKMIQWNDLGAVDLSYGRLRVIVSRDGAP